jgi:hypothetical protein
MNAASVDGFDEWLKLELHAYAGRHNGFRLTPAPSQYHASYLQAGTRVSLVAKVAALVSAKAAIGLAMGVLAVSAAGMAGEASITGSISPANWGQQVEQQVQKCKAALAPGTHGIGQCVSAFAQQHGELVSSDNRASKARENAPSPSPKSHGNGNGNGNGNAIEKAKTHGQGAGNGQGQDSGGGNGNAQGNGNAHGNGNGNGHSGH